MRELTDLARLHALMRRLGRSGAAGRAYLVGGACALLRGWRATTVAVDLALEPDSREVLEAIRDAKDELAVNVELASPSHFVPELLGWRDRSPFVAREGRLDFHEYDFYSQALAKVERDHVRDREDVRSMVAAGLVEPAKLLGLAARVEDELVRFPAVDVNALRARLQALAGA